MRKLLFLFVLTGCLKVQHQKPILTVDVDKIPVISSYGFRPESNKGKPIGNYDNDGDGIINKNDRCPDKPETINGYLDTDGCPDTIIVLPPPPPPSPTDTSQIKMPPVGNQNGEGSCVAFSVGHAARFADWYYKTGQSVIFSTEFLYNQVKFGDCSVGTSMQVALDFIRNNGICTYNSMPNVAGCSLLPDASQSLEALNYKISGYAKMYTTDRTAIKQMIDRKVPVIVSFMADNTFINAKAGFIWKTSTGGVLPHSVVFCGYDNSKNAYKIMNSWGTSWGDLGYSWIDYDLFPTVTGTYCYVIN